MRRVSERHAEDLQHLISTSVQSHVMPHNGNEAVGTDGRVNLYSDSVLGSSPEILNLEVLLEPLEDVMRSFT